MSEPLPLVLLVEDEPQMRRFLRALLDSHDYRVVEAETAREAIAQATARAPELVLLDLGLPDGDGIDMTRRLREWYRAPIIVISARGREDDKIAALDAGADDYLTKPFGAGELLARLRVALRHARQASSGAVEAVINAGDIKIDLARRQIYRGGEEVHLTPLEYKLVAVLAQNAGKVVTHRLLLREVWGPGHVEQPHYLRVYMAQIRHKLEVDAARPKYFVTEPGVGYRLKAD